VLCIVGYKAKAVLPLPPTPISSCSSEDESDED